MYFARSRTDGVDGPETRVLVSAEPSSEWVDMRVAERLRLERGGAATAAARRIAEALVPSSMSAAIAGGEAFLEAAAGALADASGDAAVEGEPRLSNALDPSGYRDYMIFEEHFSFGYKLQGQPVPGVMYEFPVAYLGNPDSFIGPGDEVVWPHYTERMDYELELGLVIGRGGTNLTPEEAREHLFGFTILNDFSARDIQFREMAGRLGPCKGKHFASSLGPVIATPDELDIEGGLRMRARVNGETFCDASSAEAIWRFEELVAWASQGERLMPGWLLGSGTCNGGSTIEIGRELSPGDEIEFEVDGLGVLRNRLGTPPSEGWWPEHRPEPQPDAEAKA
jgi:2-keto-4-pentenoate hydratase/2-oxohepta-3-ene-1,7-dioic acid hydratase in catechol pathway